MRDSAFRLSRLESTLYNHPSAWLHNRIRCNHCGDVIESEYQHDFKYCKCGLVYVDGGHSYLRRGVTYSPNDYTELSETVEEPDEKTT